MMKKNRMILMAGMILAASAALCSCQEATDLPLQTTSSVAETTAVITHTHVWGDWTTKREATKTEDGESVQSCAECGEENTQVLYAVGSEGLRFSLIGEAYSVVKIGTCKDEEIVIPAYYKGKPVVSVGKAAFSDCDTIKSVTFLGNVETIEQDAFAKCDRLEKVVLCEGLKTLGGQAFFRSSALAQVDLPQSLTVIENSAFLECSSLQSIRVPDSVSRIGEYAFRDCTNLQEATLGAGVTTIGRYAFYGCERLQAIELPVGLNSMEEFAFAMCGSLEELVIPEGVTVLRESLLYGCIKLKSLTIPKSVEQIEKLLFSGDERGLTITYNGSMSDWNAIEKAAYWDELSEYYPMPNCDYTVQCSDGLIRKP